MYFYSYTNWFVVLDIFSALQFWDPFQFLSRTLLFCMWAIIAMLGVHVGKNASFRLHPKEFVRPHVCSGHPTEHQHSVTCTCCIFWQSCALRLTCGTASCENAGNEYGILRLLADFERSFWRIHVTLLRSMHFSFCHLFFCAGHAVCTCSCASSEPFSGNVDASK